MEACELITAKEAERRVLVLENPALPGESRITKSLFGGLQIILPGEIAAPHRHTQAALRFVLEGEGAYTSVDGERTFMRPGDFVITPSWTWHDHGNVGKGPMVWLDGLDMHMIKLFEASFREGSGSDAAGEVTRPEGDSEARYGANLLPVDDGYSRPTSPVFNYRYDRTRDALEEMRAQERVEPVARAQAQIRQPQDRRLRDPDHRDLHPAIAQGLQDRALPLDRARPCSCASKARARPSSARARARASSPGARAISVVVPSWEFVRHEAASDDAVLFSYSDQGVHEKLGFFREEKRAGLTGGARGSTRWSTYSAAATAPASCGRGG